MILVLLPLNQKLGPPLLYENPLSPHVKQVTKSIKYEESHLKKGGGW